MGGPAEQGPPCCAGPRSGKVVKPYQFVASGLKGLVQPAVKCRGREYLRIIYGPEYTFPENLSRLWQRGLATKRSSPFESSLSASRASNASCVGNRSDVSTSVSSVYWPWRVSRSIRGCRQE